MKDTKADADTEVAEVAEVAAASSKRGPEANGDIGNVLLFLTQSQYDDIADLINANREQVLTAGASKASKMAKAAYDKGTGKLVEKVIADPRGLVSVFGRMLASLPSGNVVGVVVRPTLVGVLPSPGPSSWPSSCPPHARGGASRIADEEAGGHMSAPRSWGCF